MEWGAIDPPPAPSPSPAFIFPQHECKAPLGRWDGPGWSSVAEPTVVKCMRLRLQLQGQRPVLSIRLYCTHTPVHPPLCSPSCLRKQYTLRV